MAAEYAQRVRRRRAVDRVTAFDVAGGVRRPAPMRRGRNLSPLLNSARDWGRVRESLFLTDVKYHSLP